MAGVVVEVVEVVAVEDGGRVWRIREVGPACLVCGHLIPASVEVPALGERACSGCGVVR